MKRFVLIALMLVTTSTFGTTIDQDGNIVAPDVTSDAAHTMEVIVTPELNKMCMQKASLVKYAMEHRDTESLTNMIVEWGKEYSIVAKQNKSWSYASFVDGERILHDAHRRNDKTNMYRRSSDTKFVDNWEQHEYFRCLVAKY